MASKQVQDITVRLGIKGFEGLDRLKGSFRELAKVTNLSDRDISRARKTLIDFAEKAGDTQQASKGLIDALKGLQGQATRNSSTYNKLSKDIIDLNQSLRLTDAEIQKQAELLAKSARAHTQSEASIKGHVKALQDLRTQASLGGQAYNQIGVEIDQLNGKLDESTKKNRSYRSVLGRALPKDAEKLSGALEQLRQVLADSGNTAEQTGRAMAQVALGGATQSRARIVAFTEEIKNQWAAVDRLNKEFLSLPRTQAVYAQRLSELNLELNNIVIGSEKYYNILADISTLQLELQRAQSVGRGQILFERLSLPEGTASRLASTQRNLGMVIGALREEMSMLDTSTAEGSAKFAQQARQVEQLEGQLKKLNDQYVSVGQSQAAAQQGINPYGPSGARNPLYDEDMARQAVEGVEEFRKTYNDTIDSLISAKRNFREHEAQLIAENDRQEEEASRAQIARIQAEGEALDRAFMEQLELRTNLLDVQRRAAASAMGFGGQELSPLYERITGLAGASVQREQLMMGRSATQVLTDMLTAFEKGGRGVDIKQKSTQIGESIAQGVVKGASDKNVLASGANSLSEQFIASLKRAFRIKSPSGESRDEIGVPIGQGIGQGIIQGLKEVRGDVLAAVRLLFSDISASPQRAGLPAQQTALADKLQSFLARTSAKTSTYLPFARLMGEEAVSSPALTLATYRKAYERGGIVPSMYMPTEQRRNVRGVSGIPGFGLEQEIIAGAIRNVGRTGAFVGPLGGPRVSLGGARSPFGAGIGMQQPTGTPAEFQGLANALASVAKNVDVAARQIQDVGFLNLPAAATGARGFALNAAINQAAWQRRGATPFAGQSAPLFGASSPVPARGAVRYGMAAAEAFPVEGMLGQGRALALGRGGAIASTREAISSYRKAVSNFWEGETGTFETIRRIVSSGVQLSASRLARRLTESVELPNLSGIRGRIRGAMPSLPRMRMGLPNVSIPGMSALHEFLTGDEAFMRRLDRQEMAYGVSRLGGFPVSGMAQIGNVGAGGGSFVPMMGGAMGGGGGGRPPAAIVPPAAPSEYEKLTAAVNRFGDVSRRSTADLRDFSGSLRSLQDILDPTAADFKQVNQEIEKQGRLVDRELGKRQRGGRRRMTGMQVAQAAGAAVSGGIFGGPEGFLGGALGGVFGGVGGAFAGAAAGAQIGALRQQLGGFADYAAQIQKMEIALRNAAGSQDQFNQAMAAASAATRDLNVPQDVAIQGMTKLTAAVKGAGGQVSDAELVFNNVTAAIKATGGSAQDVDGAITAMVQVFSKGKVSAEELSGQLGERLPGAVTKFAKANDMTLPELQKALEQGQVGLNELMNFIVQLGDEYAGVASKIAGSSQDAGARLTVAYNNMRIAVGEALQPIGAAFQEAFIPFIEGITPVLVDVLPKLGQLMLTIAKNFDTAAIAVGAFMGVLAISKISLAVTALGGLSSALLLIKTNAVSATGALQALNATALLNPWTALATGVAAVAVAFYDAHQEKQRLDAVMESGSLDQLDAEIKRLEKSIADSESKARGYASELRGVGQESGYANIELKKTKELLESFKAEYRVKFFVEQVFSGAKGVPQGMRIINGQLAYYVPGQGWVNAQTSEPIQGAEPTEFPRPTEDKASTGKTKKERESQLPQLMAQLAVAEQIAQINEKIRQAQLQDNQFLQIRLEGEKQLAQIAGQIRAIAFEKIPADEAEVKRKLLLVKADESRRDTLQRLRQLEQQNTRELTSELDEVAKKYKEQGEQGRAIADMVKNGITPALAEAYYEIDKTFEKEKEKIQLKIAEKELAIASLAVESEIRKEIEKQIKALRELLKVRGEEVPGIKKDAEEEEARKERERKAKEQAERLKSLYSGIVSTIEDGIIGSFTAGIESLIGGTKTLGEALREIASGVLKDIGQMLLRFAVNAGMRAAFPGAFAEKGAYFANGQANFARNSIQPFANGGIVTKPTFFKYADGGTFSNGVMGEAGPEAIMPLKRGADGRLGVAVADNRSFLNAISPSNEEGIDNEDQNSSALATATRASLRETERIRENRMQIMNQQSASERRYERERIEQMASAPGKLDIKYESQVINNVEYVTRDQAERMAAQSALRGRELALGSLQNSVKTRKRVGIA